jgi:hypothetical protein
VLNYSGEDASPEAFEKAKSAARGNSLEHIVEPINKLIEGYRRFRRRYFHEEPELFASLVARGQ